MGKGSWLESEHDAPFGSVDTGQTVILERGKDPPDPPEGHVWALRGYMGAAGSTGHTHACYVLYRHARKNS